MVPLSRAGNEGQGRDLQPGAPRRDRQPEEPDRGGERAGAVGPGRGGLWRIQGHRGARGLFPENTLEGFRAARALGVTAFELDVGMTGDGVVVVCHDPRLNPAITRDATGAWLAQAGPWISALTFAELQAYDVGRIRPGSPYAAAFPDQTPIDGARIQTLLDVLRLDHSTFFNIELKTDPRRDGLTPDPQRLAEAVLAVIDQADAGARVMVESFDWRGPRHIRRLRPVLPVAWLTSPETEAASRLWWGGPGLAAFDGSVPRAVAAERDRIGSVGTIGQVEERADASSSAPTGSALVGPDNWAPHYQGISREQVEAAHGLGLAVLPWTVNEPADMRRLIAWGVDGLISDRPDIALKRLNDNGDIRTVADQ